MEEQIKQVLRIVALFDDSGWNELDSIASSLLRALVNKDATSVKSLLNELVDSLVEINNQITWRDKKAEAEFKEFIKNWR